MKRETCCKEDERAERSTQQRRLKWNLKVNIRKNPANLALTRFDRRSWVNNFNFVFMVHPGGSNLQLAAETCEFSQIPPLSMGL